MFLFFVLFLLFPHFPGFHAHDEEAYILFCPCMGRFGNQLEQFLGTLAFAKHLNRTLVLPPLVEYPPGAKEAKMREFDSLFQLGPLTAFHRCVPMRQFMRETADKIWPPERRKVLCWAPRPGLANPNSMGCHANEGNPFGPFWRHSGIQFVSDEFFGVKTGGLDTERVEIRQRWAKQFPPNEYPVLAFSSAPAAFPIRQEHRPLQRHIHWTDQIEEEATQFIDQHFGGNDAPFLAVHIRNGSDWENVCRHLKTDSLNSSAGQQLFASAQCTGYAGEFGPITAEACQPSLVTVLEEITVQVRRISAIGVFVASDQHHQLESIRNHLAREKLGRSVKIAKADGNVPVELAILGRAQHFVGNCLSTFSAFVVRQRLFGLGPQKQHRSCSFFAFPGAASEVLLDEESRSVIDEL